MTIAFYILLGVQAVCWSVFMFGDVGFDKPGKHGLDFSSFIVIGVVYMIALVSGLIVGFLKKRWLCLSIQLLPILGTALFICLPNKTYDPRNYQDLVGRSDVEVEKRIGHPRGAVTGSVSDDKHKDMDFIQLRGMVIYISSNGIVESVEPSTR